MTTQSTIDKLIEMRLTSMSDAFRTQMEDPRMKGIPFEDRFGMLVDIEYSNRKSNSVYCIIKFPKVAEAIPQSCRGNFPNNAAVFGASLSLLGW